MEGYPEDLDAQLLRAAELQEELNRGIDGLSYEYPGEWVIIRDGVVIDHDPDSRALRDRTEQVEGDIIMPIPPPGPYFLMNEAA